MSSQLASIVPPAPLSDEVFSFNQEHFLKIRGYQESDLGFLSSPPVRAIVEAADVAGGTATGITAGVGNIAHTGAATLFGGIGKITGGLPGGGLLHQASQGVLSGIDRTEKVAEQLVDPTRVVRDHIHFSNDVKDNLPAAVTAIDTSIHAFSTEIGNQCQELYENIATKGIQIIAGLEARLVDVNNALLKLIDVLTKNNLAENLKVGQDKYQGINIPGISKLFLGDIATELPPVLKTVNDVKAAFDAILANLKLAKDKINSGVTDPNKIFSQKYEVVVLAWQTFQEKRKTMTYVPYDHGDESVPTQRKT